ncbi:MAG: hypothetical protein CW338_01135 [Clostridiales bacterium]|nr:hypothetical protein [Clostridiales bacterium]
MNTFGETIMKLRKERRLSRLKLSTLCDISHTEIARIETGERNVPSLPHLYALADTLGVSREEMLSLAGYAPAEADATPLERAFPNLKTVKQKETAGRIVAALERGGDLKDEDLDDLYDQVEMFLQYRSRLKERE